MTTETNNNKETYNGWTNYETRNATLWIDNDQGEATYWNDNAACVLGESVGDGFFTREEMAALKLAISLKSYFDENMEDLGVPKLSGMYADLLNAALSQINWHEIALSLINDVKEVK